MTPTTPVPIADALVTTICAYTSLATARHYGLLDRERRLYSRLWPSFRRIVFVTYGDRADHDIAASLVPELADRVTCICNDEQLEPGIFLGTVPGRALSILQDSNCRTALVHTEQHWGGDVALNTARHLRASGFTVGLCARCGYHWSWTEAREHGTGSRPFAQARFTEGELCRAADIIVGTTRKIVDDLAFQHALPPDRTRLVPNFLITEQAVPAFETRTPGLILTAGRLAREKRIDLLLHGIARLPDQLRRSARLCIVGSGPVDADLRALAERLRITTEFRGRLPHDDLLTLMGRASVYAQLSEYEGHPKTVLEAMAMGAPALVCEAPGMSEHIRHGVTGCIAHGEPGSVADSLARLLTDSTHARSLSAAASNHVRTALGLDTIFPLYRQACTDAMHTAGAGRTMPEMVVRWDQPMLELPPSTAAATWTASLEAFAKRLDPERRAAFLEEVQARLEAPLARA